MKTNSLRAWIIAMRPKTLTAAVAPVIIGMALAAKDTSLQVDWVPGLLCFLFAMIMQIDANFVNDYFDWKHGNDDASTRLGPLRACSMGWVTPKAMLWALLITTAIAGCVGLPLIFYGGVQMLFVGIACVVFCLLYTTLFSYIGLGDVLVLLFFGIIPVSVTYYILTGVVSLPIICVSIACGLAVDNLLILNNYRDIDNDRRDGKRTLIVMTGKEWGRRLYFLLGTIATLLMAIYDGFTAKSALMLIYFLLNIQAYIKMGRLQGRDLNRVLGMTSRNILAFCLLSILLILM